MSFEDNPLSEVNVQKANAEKTKKRAGARRKSKGKNGAKSKARNREHAIFKTNSVPVQPPIESVIKIEGGVSLKTKNSTIKGAEKKKNKIENLSRSEYNEYIEKLRYIPKTHTFDTRMETNKNENDNVAAKDDDTNEQRVNQINFSINTQQNASSPKSHRSSTSRMQRMRIDHSNTPRSPKFERGQKSQTTDRLISAYNKNSLLPKIEGMSTEDFMDWAAKSKARNSESLTAQQTSKYQKEFIVRSPKAKIEKSSLGKALFPSTD